MSTSKGVPYMQEEKWEPIPSLNGRYEASSLGRIRKVSTGRIRKLKPRNTDGYVAITHWVYGHWAYGYLHRLVYEAFHGELPEEIDHIDGDKANNAITNLRGCTSEENKRYYFERVGSNPVGEICWANDRNKWRARSPRSHGRKWLGQFVSRQEAEMAIKNYLEGVKEK